MQLHANTRTHNHTQHCTHTDIHAPATACVNRCCGGGRVIVQAGKSAVAEDMRGMQKCTTHTVANEVLRVQQWMLTQRQWHSTSGLHWPAAGVCTSSMAGRTTVVAWLVLLPLRTRPSSSGNGSGCVDGLLASCWAGAGAATGSWADRATPHHQLGQCATRQHNRRSPSIWVSWGGSTCCTTSSSIRVYCRRRHHRVHLQWCVAAVNT